MGSHHGYIKTVEDQTTGVIFLSQHDPPTRTPSLGPGQVIKVNPAPRGCNIRATNQKSRRRGFGQRKRGKFYQDVQQIKKDWKRNEADHPRGYVFESHHEVFPVPAPTAANLSQPGVRILPSGVIDHFIEINATHVPVPQPPPTGHQVRRKFKRVRVELSDGKNLKTKYHFFTQVFLTHLLNLLETTNL